MQGGISMGKIIGYFLHGDRQTEGYLVLLCIVSLGSPCAVTYCGAQNSQGFGFGSNPSLNIELSFLIYSIKRQ